MTFTLKDGQLAHAQLFLPRDTGVAKPHPAIMFFHDDPRRQILLGFNPMDAYNWMYALNQYFVAEGIIVIAVVVQSDGCVPETPPAIRRARDAWIFA